MNRHSPGGLGLPHVHLRSRRRRLDLKVLTLLPAIDQLALLEQRKISPLELADEYIAQIERLNPLLNAVIDFDAERVRTQARQIRSGTLAGLPLTIKSSIAVQGHRCEIGSVLNRGKISDRDARGGCPATRQRRRVSGHYKLPEFLMAYETDDPLLYGKTNKFVDLELSAGGSKQRRRRRRFAAGLCAGGLGSSTSGGF